ncbi:hypothetical protein, partial [Pseudomonas sp. RSP]|uniref:hypothetical protein n=1 Tax=Pseudomonas sp. RSP TaxID=3462641 RepID=UPI004053CD98
MPAKIADGANGICRYRVQSMSKFCPGRVGQVVALEQRAFSLLYADCKFFHRPQLPLFTLFLSFGETADALKPVI